MTSPADRPRRPRRALLFVPATERKKIEKAAGLGVDGVIIDLEDAAALSQKQAAREAAVAALAEIDFGRSERIARVNPRSSGLFDDDLAAIAGGKRFPDAIVLPKVESGEDVVALGRAIVAAEAARNMAPGAASGGMRILAIIESARGVAHLLEIASACDRIDALIFGAEDLCADAGAVRAQASALVAHARCAVLIHAAAARLQAIDTPFVDLQDEAGLIAETRDAMHLGYAGKLAIHPKQVAPIVAVFTPPEAEVAAAERLLAEHARHQAEGRGVFALDGKMVDMPMVRAAERVVARARGAGVR